jgi:hypothetical protein
MDRAPFGLLLRYELVRLDYDVAGHSTVIYEQENGLSARSSHQLFVLSSAADRLVIDFLDYVTSTDSRRGRCARRVD